MRQQSDHVAGESEIRNPKSKIRSGFTLTEILVTIGIIVLLISITIPVVSKVQKSARVAGVQAQMNGLVGAITRYQQDHGSLPGPIANDNLRLTGFGGFANPTNIPTGFVVGLSAPNSYDISGTENLVLGLLGGLVLQGTPAAPVIAYDPSQVGNGPSNLNFGQLKKFPPYIEATNLSWRVNDDGDKTGDYLDNAGDADDSIIPEFVDTFSSPLPILYLRAKKGTRVSPPFTATNNPVITNVPTPNANGGAPQRVGQYDFSQFSGYVEADTKGNFIGEGKSIDPNAYKPDGKRPTKGGQLPHGLTPPVELDVSMDKGDPSYEYPYNSYIYLKNPSSPTTDPQPRQKDGYILISAGLDRVYGTPDDITSFGAVNE